MKERKRSKIELKVDSLETRVRERDKEIERLSKIIKDLNEENNEWCKKFHELERENNNTANYVIALEEFIADRKLDEAFQKYMEGKRNEHC